MRLTRGEIETKPPKTKLREIAHVASVGAGDRRRRRVLLEFQMGGNRCEAHLFPIDKEIEGDRHRESKRRSGNNEVAGILRALERAGRSFWTREKTSE